MKYIGIDLGGTNIAVGLVDENGTILEKASLPTNAKRSADEITEDMIKLIFTVCERRGISSSDVDFVGVACPGVADSSKGTIKYTCNLPFSDYPIVEKICSKTGVKSAGVDNDANAAAKGEAEVGAAKGFSSSVMITLGTGVGGGIIVDHKILSGFNSTAAELGHMVIVKDGRPCSCGRRGCFETYSSATGLVRTTREMMEKNKDTFMWDIVKGDIMKVNGRTAFDAMRAGDNCGKAVVDEYISYLASGVANIANILAPEIISIGGGISNEGDTLLLPLRKEVSENLYAHSAGVKETEIRIAKLKNDAGIIGAAMLGVGI
ncbi:MAG: ROK family protein [Ruminococcaceae bacterium]|nr:ROK family protein [Oscillospiraceae bacterium]